MIIPCWNSPSTVLHGLAFLSLFDVGMIVIHCTDEEIEIPEMVRHAQVEEVVELGFKPSLSVS